jgi:hypothetical protein
LRSFSFHINMLARSDPDVTDVDVGKVEFKTLPETSQAYPD